MNNLGCTIDKSQPMEMIYKTPIFDVIEKDGIIRLHAPNWINVAVFNRDYDEWIMAKEHRHGINKDVQEFMSGTIEEGESAKAAAIRELKEELGYDPLNIVRIEKLYCENVNPAFMDNEVTGFYIEVEGNPGNTNFDEDENVETVQQSFPVLLYNGLISELTYCKLKELGLYK